MSDTVKCLNAPLGLSNVLHALFDVIDALGVHVSLLLDKVSRHAKEEVLQLYLIEHHSGVRNDGKQSGSLRVKENLVADPSSRPCHTQVEFHETWWHKAFVKAD